MSEQNAVGRVRFVWAKRFTVAGFVVYLDGALLGVALALVLPEDGKILAVYPAGLLAAVGVDLVFGAFLAWLVESLVMRRG